MKSVHDFIVSIKSFHDASTCLGNLVVLYSSATVSHFHLRLISELNLHQLEIAKAGHETKVIVGP